MVPRGPGRGRICGSLGSGRCNIGRLRRNGTKDFSLNNDVGNTCTTKDDEWGLVNDDVGSGAKHYGNRAELIVP